MARLLLAALYLVTLPAIAYASPTKNEAGKWALHGAGTHNSKANTCAFQIVQCSDEISVYGGSIGERNDIYVLALDVHGIAGTRYGLCCDGPLYFYGWTKCSDFEIPTQGWPGCGEANAQTWGAEQIGPFITIGILDVYVYGTSRCLCVCADPRVGFAEFCDGSEPSPLCIEKTHSAHFGCVEFNGSGCGYNPCGTPVPTESSSWGAVKALYR
jgi:hypothetical protein